MHTMNNIAVLMKFLDIKVAATKQYGVIWQI